MDLPFLKLERFKKELLDEIIYFDNAATSFPKPLEVIESVLEVLSFCSANPGRSGHLLSVKAGELVFEARLNIASFFGISNPMNVIFDLNATAALNLAIKGFAYKHVGSHVITSSIEHNSTVRPLVQLRNEGIIFLSIARGDKNGILSINELERLRKSNTNLLVINHTSNVTGATQYLKKICKWCRKNNITSIVDVSQSAGFERINMKECKIDIICFTGHKGLYGPMGIGGMVLNDDFDFHKIKPIKQGGTGSYSAKLTQPRFLPDIFESGTLPLPAIVGLNTGVNFVRVNLENIRKRKEELEKYFIQKLNAITEAEIYNGDYLNGVVSFRLKNVSVSELTDVLSKKFKIMSRQGLHCAPLMHKRLGTFPEGLVRFSFSYKNTFSQIDKAINAIRKVINE